jgi:hypothetical protein
VVEYGEDGCVPVVVELAVSGFSLVLVMLISIIDNVCP